MQLANYGSIRSWLYDQKESRHPLLDYYLSHYEPELGPALEPMCGTGFFLIHYLKAGVDIDGTDASADMLQRCREKCRESGLSPDLYEQRLEDLDLPRRYGNIHIPDGSFSHLHDKAVAQQALSRLYEHLLPGGKLLVDAHVPLPEPPETGRWLLGRLHECDDGSTILVSTLEHYEDHCRLWKRVIKYEKFVDGRLADSEMALHAIRFYDLTEFESMLAAAGFTDIRNIPSSPLIYGELFAVRRGAS